MKTLNIIGCGKVGKTLGRLWVKAGIFDIGDILNRSVDSAGEAALFIGAGRAVPRVEEMRPADVFFIGTPDIQIRKSCEALAASDVAQNRCIVFHCSGALPSADLKSAKMSSAFTASVHPVKSFTDPILSVNTIDGTYFGLEGDKQALDVLIPAIEAVGGKPFSIDPEQKTLYHSATVITCNYLTALLEIGIQTFIKAGLNREIAIQVMQPIVRETVENIFQYGPVKALTGPIARGDSTIVEQQIDALSQWQSRYGDLYRILGHVALELSRQKGTISTESVTALRKILEHPNTICDKYRDL